jgi:uncharacterized protein
VAGTKAGGRSAASTNKAKYGADFYARIGAMGGKKGRTGGFFADRELARRAGRIGGLKSRRNKKAEQWTTRLMSFGLAILLLVAGCVMTAKFHAFAGVLILLMCGMVIWFGVLAINDTGE